MAIPNGGLTEIGKFVIPVGSMNKTIVLLIALLVLSGAAGQTPDEQRRAVRRAKMERLFAIEGRAQATRPVRREGPMRADNIRDEEVREIQQTASTILPGAIVNISAVVSGCPCEDGSMCSDQVWIVAYRPEKSSGLLLSKIGGHWTIGPVQQWRLEYEKLHARRGRLSTDDEDALYERFPACAVAEPSPSDTRTRTRP